MNGLNIIRKYEEDYWQAIAKAREFLPEGILPDFIAVIQQVVIYDCTDGYLILRYGERERNKFIITRHRSISWQELLHQQKLYNQYGEESTWRITSKNNAPTKLRGQMVSIGELQILSSGNILRPKYLSAAIVFDEPSKDFHSGDKDAKTDIRTFLAATNLGVPVVQGTQGTQDTKDTSDKVIKKLENLLAEYRQCLASAKHEEDAQTFLKQNPFILNPYSTNISPKYQMGKPKQYVCDFLIEDRLAPGFKYIFVEIEPVKTELFHRSKKEEKEFKARVHHGLNQLRDWEIWTRDNIASLRQDFPEFDQAGFILVIGRNTNLSQAQRKVLTDENARARNRTILTYDDLANRLERMINNLRELIANTTT